MIFFSLQNDCLLLNKISKYLRKIWWIFCRLSNNANNISLKENKNKHDMNGHCLLTFSVNYKSFPSLLDSEKISFSKICMVTYGFLKNTCILTKSLYLNICIF